MSSCEPLWTHVPSPSATSLFLDLHYVISYLDVNLDTRLCVKVKSSKSSSNINMCHCHLLTGSFLCFISDLQPFLEVSGLRVQIHIHQILHLKGILNTERKTNTGHTRPCLRAGGALDKLLS